MRIIFNTLQIEFILNKLQFFTDPLNVAYSGFISLYKYIIDNCSESFVENLYFILSLKLIIILFPVFTIIILVLFSSTSGNGFRRNSRFDYESLVKIQPKPRDQDPPRRLDLYTTIGKEPNSHLLHASNYNFYLMNGLKFNQDISSDEIGTKIILWNSKLEKGPSDSPFSDILGHYIRFEVVSKPALEINTLNVSAPSSIQSGFRTYFIAEPSSNSEFDKNFVAAYHDVNKKF